MIDHDQNGPFVRAYGATTEPQTERVYAVEVKRGDDVEYWDLQFEPDNERARGTIRVAQRHLPGAVCRIMHREITIVATDWIYDV